MPKVQKTRGTKKIESQVEKETVRINRLKKRKEKKKNFFLLYYLIL